MTNASNTDDRTTDWIRRIARAVGSLVAALWLVMGIGSGIADPGPWTWESVVMTVLISTSVLGVLIAWWREGMGGVIVLICAIAHSTFAYLVAGHNKALAMSVSGGPLLLVGILFLASRWRSRRGGD